MNSGWIPLICGIIELGHQLKEWLGRSGMHVESEHLLNVPRLMAPMHRRPYSKGNLPSFAQT